MREAVSVQRAGKSGTREIPRVDILSVRVSVVTMPILLNLVRDAIESRSRLRAAFCTVHTVTECQDSDALREAVNSSEVVCPDGMPLVWLCRGRGAAQTRRVYGPDALLAVCEDGVAGGYRHYFYGSTTETLQRLTSNLRQRFPGIIIAGAYSPPFRPASPHEDAAAIEQINASRADIVWVGLGMPRQELWAAEHQDLLEAPVLMPVGAAFDFHAGTVRQAPLWMQRSGTEWLFRLTQEPRRLWRRYLLGNSRFVYLLAREWLRTQRR